MTEINNLERECQRLLAEQIDVVSKGGQISDAREQTLEALNNELSVKRSKLANTEAAHRAVGPLRRQDRDCSDEALRGALRDVLTIEAPSDERARLRRIAVVEACLSRVIVHRHGEDLHVELHGPLVPKAWLSSESQQNGEGDERLPVLPVSPTDAASGILDEYLASKESENEGTPNGNGEASELEQTQEANASAGSPIPPAKSRLSRRYRTQAANGPVLPYEEVEQALADGIIPQQNTRPLPRLPRERMAPCWQSALIGVTDPGKNPDLYDRSNVQAVRTVWEKLGRRRVTKPLYRDYCKLNPELDLPAVGEVGPVIRADAYLERGEGHSGPPPEAGRPLSECTLDTCRESIRKARARLDPRLPLQRLRYEYLAADDATMANWGQLAKVLAAHDLTFGRFRDEVLGATDG